MTADGNQSMNTNFGAEMITPNQFFAGNMNSVGHYHSVGVDSRSFTSNYLQTSCNQTLTTQSSIPTTITESTQHSKNANRLMNGGSNRVPKARTLT